MAKLPLSFLRLALVAVVLALPTIVVLALLVSAGALSPGWAVGAGLAVLAWAGAAVAYHWHGIARAAVAVLRLKADGSDGPLPSVGSGLLRPLVTAIGQALGRARHRQEETTRALAASEGVIEALPDPLLIVDGAGRVIRANAAARALFGARPGDSDLSAYLRAPQVLDAVSAVLAGGEGHRAEFRQAGPPEHIFAAVIEPLANGAGARSAMVSLQDITAVRRTEQMRTDFVANASHELRTPLSALLGFIETLRGPARDDPEAQARFLGIMHQQASRMSRLIADLLSLSQIEVHEHNPPASHVDIPELVKATAATFELKAAARGIRLRLEPAPDLPAAVADEDQIAQVVQNLIDNAIKYGREGTEVTVSLGRADGAALSRPGGPFVFVAVRDEGAGIPQVHLPRLTQRFYRVDAARSRLLGGTGLGLAIVQHIVNRHRGHLSIESTEGKGSAFTVYLPITSTAVAGPNGNRLPAA